MLARSYRQQGRCLVLLYLICAVLSHFVSLFFPLVFLLWFIIFFIIIMYHFFVFIRSSSLLCCWFIYLFGNQVHQRNYSAYFCVLICMLMFHIVKWTTYFLDFLQKLNMTIAMKSRVGVCWYPFAPSSIVDTIFITCSSCNWKLLSLPSSYFFFHILFGCLVIIEVKI